MSQPQLFVQFLLLGGQELLLLLHLKQTGDTAGDLLRWFGIRKSRLRRRSGAGGGGGFLGCTQAHQAVQQAAAGAGDLL